MNHFVGSANAIQAVYRLDSILVGEGQQTAILVLLLLLHFPFHHLLTFCGLIVDCMNSIEESRFSLLMAP